MSLCAFFLNLTISSTLRKLGSKNWLIWTSLVLVSVVLPIGAYLGATIVLNMPESFLIETLAFGVAALLYLGVEELLVDAHKEEDAAWISAPFFVGFLLILLFKF